MIFLFEIRLLFFCMTVIITLAGAEGFVCCELESLRR